MLELREGGRANIFPFPNLTSFDVDLKGGEPVCGVAYIPSRQMPIASHFRQAKPARVVVAICLMFLTSSGLAVHAQTANIGPTWDSVGLWNLSNVTNSTVTFPSNTSARFDNFLFSWPPGVSLGSKGTWTVDSRLVLLERLRAWNFSDVNGGFAWQTALEWGSGSAIMGYGRDDTHTPDTGIMVGGECTEGATGSVLTAADFLGRWLTANITLDASTQMMYFSAYDSNGALIGQTSSPGYCGTMFGTLPVNVLFFTSFGIADVDWISLTSGKSAVLFDDFLNGQPITPTHAGSSGNTTLTVNPRTTSTTVSCSPTSVQIGQPTTCTAIVADSATGTPSAPIGTVNWTSSGPGTFSATLCSLSQTGTTASCSVNYTPKASGPVIISANYGGNASLSAATQPMTLTVTGSSLQISYAFLAELLGVVAIAGIIMGALVTAVLGKTKRRNSGVGPNN